jgi:hypothetical protein
MNSLLPATRAASIPALRAKVRSKTRRRLVLGLCLTLPLSAALAQQAGTTSAPSIGDIVQRLVAQNEHRAQQLGPYTSQRHYHISYKGFPHGAEADMVVDVSADNATSKRFAVVSESGSHLLLDHVLHKLLKTEQDSSHDRTDSALTPANYSFNLVRAETDDGRLTFVLGVQPRTPRTLLYRGTIWVDATDYAVVKIEAQPAKNPSFWIRSTDIHHVYSKTGDFWLPLSNRSESKVRLGGTAVLTIEYGDYRFANTAPSQAEVSEPVPSAQLR